MSFVNRDHYFNAKVAQNSPNETRNEKWCPRFTQFKAGNKLEK